MTVTINAQQVLEALRADLEKNGPDFVYNSGEYHEPYDSDDEPSMICLYIVDGKPSCLVGRVLAALGVSLESLNRNEGQSARSLELLEDNDGNPVYLTSGTRDILNAAQQVQDRQNTLGEALEAAEKTAGALQVLGLEANEK